MTLLLALLLAGCAQQSTATRPQLSKSLPTPTANTRNEYRDPVLGFQVELPPGWSAASYPGRHLPAVNVLVVLHPRSPTPATITLGVFQSATVPTAFAARGQPTSHIGSYPSFAADTGLSQGKVPCVVRIFLAANDYVLAEWCAMDASSHSTEFERILATFVPAPAGFVWHGAASAPPSDSCSGIQTANGYRAAQWGETLAAPVAKSPAGGWAGLYGVTICSNSGSPDHYLFQCTELINRYDAEQWGLPHIPGSAARYFDYYQNGALHPGTVRDLPAGRYSFSDDARQGRSAFAPRPGDLLIFQDVANPAQGWESGLIASPGHVALITAIDAHYVYVAQENYNDRQYFLALPLAYTTGGYAITDRSGVRGRIVRGWIRFSVESQ